MENYKKYNREEVLKNVEKRIAESEAQRAKLPYYGFKKFRIREVCNELSIFDWWNEYLSLSQLKQMRSFLITAGKLGYNGYVCFKVGAAGCAHGMWASKAESTNGYSPDGECLYHSFRSGDNYYDVQLADGRWGQQILGNCDLTLQEVKSLIGA